MIVYNVQDRFFTMQKDADRARIDAGLPKDQLFKIRIENRDQLAEFLNGLCKAIKTHNRNPDPVAPEYTAKQVVPDYVPDFLAKSWGYGKETK